MYVRFVVNAVDDNSQRRMGVIIAAYELKHGDRLSAEELAHMNEITRWLDLNLEAPERFSRSRRSNAHAKAISWFRASALEHIEKVRSLCRLVERYGTSTVQITTRKPGYIVYEDEYQICAVPFADTRA